MSERIEPRTLKGFKDYLPEEAKLRQKITDTCRQVFELFGFSPLDTPALEYLDILSKKYGEDEKLIYSFEDRGGRQVGLRYDLTVPLARVVAQYQNEIRLPFRRYQIANVWRAENPQKGRYREFIQADADIVGVESLSADAECVAVYNEILLRLGINDFKILINSREIFNQLGKELSLADEQLTTVVRVIDKLDKITEDQAEAILKGANINDKQIKKINQFLNTPSASQPIFLELKKYLDALGVPQSAYEFDTKIARGLDYYTGTVFEVFVAGSDFGSFGGAGRYDDLVSKFSGKKIPAVGMSVGVDRILAYLLERGVSEPAGNTKVLVMNLGNKFTPKSLEVLRVLRGYGINSAYYYDDKDLDKQFKYAESQNIPYAILIGDDELEGNKVTLRDLKSRTQAQVNLEEALEKIKAP